MTRKLESYFFRVIFLICFLILGLSSCRTSYAQKVLTKENVGKSILKQFNKSERTYQEGKENKAIAQLQKIIEKEPYFIDAQILLGRIYFLRDAYDLARIYFLNAYRIDGNYDERVILALSNIYELDEDYEKAIQFLSEYLNLRIDDLDLDQRKKLEKKVELLTFRNKLLNNPIPFNPEKLSGSINTDQYSEYLPSINPAETVFYFTRVINNQEDIFYSLKMDNGEWSDSKLLPAINSYENEGAHCISATGNDIFFTFCSDGRTGKPRGCNIYQSRRIGGKWTKPRYLSEINSKSWDAQPSISSDGNVLFFSSRREGGFGGSDLWFSEKQENGKWTKPQNLGEKINTKGNEESPFIFADGESLYFKSDEHLGMGSFDLFMSRKAENETWNRPVNLGFPINTKDHEGALIVTLDGKTAYYAKGSGDVKFDQKETDIYKFFLPPAFSSNPTGFLDLTVLEEETNNPINCLIEIQENTKTGLRLKNIGTDLNGNAFISLNIGKDYAILIDKPGYNLVSRRIELSEELGKPLIKRKEVIYLKKEIQIDSISEPIVLNNILFNSGSADLKEESFFEMDKLFELLLENPELKAEIWGHTDNIGSEIDNLALSELRAKSVYDYLVSKGINANRVTYKGFGESKPIADNDTVEGRRKNRRTELVKMY